MLDLHPYIVAVFLSCSLSALSQSHDFEVRDFHENMTDLKAASSNVKDINGVVAALIRFAVRDTLFSFEANNGIIKRTNEVGEILLYVPVTTKRITIKHPNLGILRDYQLPVAVKSRTTYDAEIVITNADYMRRIYGYEQRPVQKDEPSVDVIEKPESKEPPLRNDYPILNDEPRTWDDTTELDDIYGSFSSTSKRRNPIQTHFLLGGGYNPLGVAGPTALIGVEIGAFLVSADYTFGLEKVEGVAIYYDNSFSEAYDYSVSRFSARLGFNTSPNSTVQVVPQLGASFNMIKGDEIKKTSTNTQFSKATPLSLSVAVSLRVRLAKPLYLYVTPQYDFAVGADDVYKVIKDADSKIKGWGEGFGVSAGLLLRF